MSLLQLQALCSLSSPYSHNNKFLSHISRPDNRAIYPSNRRTFVRTTVKAVGTVPDKKSDSLSDTTTNSEPEVPQDPPTVGFAFFSSVLLPDGTPDIHRRSAPGGQTLRKIMMDSNIELYGPYSRALLNCAGGGTCATCMVEVLEDSGLLNPRTDKEKEKLKRKPKNWRLACQTIVGEPDSRGAVVIQQLPEWKGHQWKYDKITEEEEEESE